MNRLFEQKLERGAATMAEHKNGEMNIEVQEKTFHGFIKMVTWGIVICILVLVFLALFNT